MHSPFFNLRKIVMNCGRINELNVVVGVVSQKKMSNTGTAQYFSRVVKEFRALEKVSIEAVEGYLFNDLQVAETVRTILQSQTEEFMPEVFQWLYDCVSLKRKSSKVFVFVMQFVPDLVFLYLLCAAENLQTLKAPVEVLLRRISKEVEAEKETPLQVPTLTRPSIYHQNLSFASQSRLTESALSRHDHDQVSSSSHTPTFSDQEITVTNRLSFLTSITRACTNRLCQFSSQSQTAFCQMCTRLILSGMTERCIVKVSQSSTNHQTCLSADYLLSLRKAKRISLNDEFVSSLLHGLRMCLFQSCHYAAKQALQAAKVRTEYNLFPQSLQVCQSLERLMNEIHPLKLPLDTEIHKTYSVKDASNWPSKPSTVIRTLMGQALYHNLNPPSSADNPHDVLDERLSLDFDELLISQSYEHTSRPGRALEQRASDSPDEGVTFDVGKGSLSDEESSQINIQDIDQSPSIKKRLGERDNGGYSDNDDMISPSDITIVLDKGTPERTFGDDQSATSRLSNVSSSSIKATAV